MNGNHAHVNGNGFQSIDAKLGNMSIRDVSGRHPVIYNLYLTIFSLCFIGSNSTAVIAREERDGTFQQVTLQRQWDPS